LVSGALEVKRNNRKVKLSKAYKKGYLEFQDINSQLACELIPLSDGFRVLDFCAGGGGKALALKDRVDIDISTYDVNSVRMKDIPVRSERAGVKVKIFLDLKDIARTEFDLVLCDVPCTGSGAWRRNPEGKWSLTVDKYNLIQKEQVSILNTAKTLVKEGGSLVYMTCSFLKSENEDQIKKFLVSNTNWKTTLMKNLSNKTNGDGFFIAILRNNFL
jgi:16S rRNA (cytosine967-C5)-methyltransferase